MRMWKKAVELAVHRLVHPYDGEIRAQIVRTGVPAVKNARDVFNSVGGVEILTAARTLTAAESGETFFLAAAAGFTVTLPAPAVGLRYRFVVSTAPTGGNYVIATNGGSDILKGHVTEGDPTAAAASPSDDNADVVNLVQNVALAGDEVQVISDGTSWFFRGSTRADGGVTTATT